MPIDLKLSVLNNNLLAVLVVKYLAASVLLDREVQSR